MKKEQQQAGSGSAVRVHRKTREDWGSDDDLRASEHRLMLALDSTGMGTWDWNLDTDEVWWNDRQFELFGIPPDKFSGSGAEVFAAIHPEDSKLLRKAVEQSLEHGGMFQVEFRVVLPDGNVRWLDGRGQKIANHPDGARRMTGVNFDITESKLMQQERAEYVRLEDRAQMHRLHVAGEIAALLAHQLNQPLAAIRSFAEAKLAQMRRTVVEQEDLATTLQDIVEQSERAAKSIRDLRKFLARQPQDMVAADINAEVRAACKLMQVLTHGRKVRFKLDLDASMPMIPMRPSQIEQVIVNLIENAMDAIAEAGHRQGTIQISTMLDHECKQAVTRVVDSGPGLGVDAAVRVFEPLYTTKKNGIGMGLVISRSIIEGHGGRLWAEPGEGGRFLFTLPVSQ